jgi:signal transduction histidine kinase
VLSTNVLALSKYENTEIIGEKAVFSLDEQIRRVIALTGPKWSEKGIDLHVDMEDDVAYEGNEDLTQQIWLNLLANAINFSPRGSVIDIQLRRQGNTICFTIQDEGVGMDEQAQAHCFDKFFQEDESQSGPGNGLGLAIVKRIVELHGGVVDVRSAPAQGSEFTVIL